VNVIYRKMIALIRNYSTAIATIQPIQAIQRLVQPVTAAVTALVK